MKASATGGGGAEDGGGDGDGAGFGEGGAGGVGDFGVGEVVFDAGEDGGIGGRNAVVIAEEGVEGIGGGTNYGDGLDFGAEGKREFAGFTARLRRILE